MILYMLIWMVRHNIHLNFEYFIDHFYMKHFCFQIFICYYNYFSFLVILFHLYLVLNFLSNNLATLFVKIIHYFFNYFYICSPLLFHSINILSALCFIFLNLFSFKCQIYYFAIIIMNGLLYLVEKIKISNSNLIIFISNLILSSFPNFFTHLYLLQFPV